MAEHPLGRCGFDSRQAHAIQREEAVKKLTDERERDVDEMAGNFERTLGSRDPEESDEDFFRSW